MPRLIVVIARSAPALAALVLSACSLSAAHTAGADTYRITIPEELVESPVSGRLILAFITADGPEWRARMPLEAPFYDLPQPLAGVDVDGAQPGATIEIDDECAMAFPGRLTDLHGTVRVQAVLRRNFNERSFVFGEGNLYSGVATMQLHADRHDETIEITLTHVMPARTLPAPPANLRWVELDSGMLSEFHGRKVAHRAGVVLPPEYHEDESKRWPTIYVVPGFGGREDRALNYAEMMRVVPKSDVPQAVWVILDPESALGHHGFCDSENNGPVGTAFIEELIPHLESEFRIDTRPESRILYGHSSGGWSVLWLQINWPQAFGACWSSAPDPVDFSRFQYSNLQDDRNLYEFALRNETPSYRTVDYDGRDIVHMTVREECMMERVIDPRGRSGEQWDAWVAMWSPRDDQTGLPARMFDPATGAIDPQIVRSWEKYDIASRAIREWDSLGPVFRDKVRLFCGEFDNFYLDRGVRVLKSIVDVRLVDVESRAGYVEIVEFAAHGSLVAIFTERMHREMIEYLKSIE